MNINEKAFSLLENLGIPVLDNPYARKEQDSFPFVLIRTASVKTKERNRLKERTVIFLIDIYSNYEGEKEVSDLYEAILENFKGFEAEPTVSRTADGGLKILDDNTLGPILKHGMLTYTVKTTELVGGV